MIAPAILTALLIQSPLMAADTTTHAMHRPEPTVAAQPTPLTEAGNDAFATIQEVVRRLNADPNTDWSRVDLEALRRHLVDMRNFTLNVEVVEQTPVEHGVRVVVRPTTPDAGASLARVLMAHPAPLNQETGWNMDVGREGNAWAVTVTSPDPDDAERIRGLGYIGIMATGAHHQLHHWMIATGANPHHGHR